MSREQIGFSELQMP